ASVIKEVVDLNFVCFGTMRFTLEKDIANYICQQDENEKPDYGVISNWFSVWRSQYMQAKAPGRGNSKSSAGASIKPADIPRYSVATSRLLSIEKRKRDAGLVVEDTRTNEDGIYITSNGAFSMRPSNSERGNMEMAKEYEALSSEIMEFLADAGLPLAAFYMDNIHEKYPFARNDDVEKIKQLRNKLREFEGVIVGYDWDNKVEARATSTPGVLNTGRGIGSVGASGVEPDDLAIADFLGMDLAREGETPIRRSFNEALPYIAGNAMSNEQLERHIMDASKYPEFVDESNVFGKIIRTWIYRAYVENKAPKLDDIIKRAMANLGYEKIPSNPPEHDALSIYVRYIDKDGNFQAGNAPMRAVISMVNAAVADSSAADTRSLLLMRTTSEYREENGRYPSAADIEDALSESEFYFDPRMSPMSDFPRLFRYLGGQVLKLIMDAVGEITPAEAMTYKNGQAKTYQFGTTLPDYRGETRPLTTEVSLVPNNELLDNVLPAVKFMTKYLDNKDAIFERATKLSESFQPRDGFDNTDINVYGLNNEKEPRMLFPHQVETQAYLRGENPPSFAILALEPGGGKTGQGTIDIATLIGDMQKVGKKIVPLIIAPDGLLNTWTADIEYFLGGNFNVFPINADIKDRWTFPQLLERIKSAPANTIF